MKRSLLLLALSLGLFCSLAGAEVRLPHMLSSHAVLQRDRPIHIWGWATPGAHIIARLHGQTVPAMADSIGKWSLWFKPETAGGPYELMVEGDGPAVTRGDILIGDVWFASGQSNMEMPLEGFGPATPVKDGEQEIAAANQPRLRLLLVAHKGADYPQDDIAASWTECTPATARHFSAVAYLFGKQITARERVPVGLVDSTWGGTPADSWVSMDTLGTDPSLLPAFAARARFADRLADVPAQLQMEQKTIAAAQASGKPAPPFPWHPDPMSYIPAGLFNGMIAPFTPMSIRGFLWYQGETNSGRDRAPYYQTLFPALIEDWRTQFAQGMLPFLFVQISSFDSPAENWGEVRDAQRRTLKLSNTAMAVTLDIGMPHNVHPPDKQTVADRLALAARAISYGERIPYASPLYREATHELLPDGTEGLRVWFDHAEGLSYRGRPATGFEVAGADGKFIAADAAVEGSSVLVHASAVQAPVAVRFGWTGVVEDNLFNEQGLPASTFTSQPLPVR